MIIYRKHTGSLEESLKTKKEFENEEEMKKYIVDSYKMDGILSDPPFEIDDIIIDEKTVEDKRCGWKDCRYVCIKRFRGMNFIKNGGSPQCIGMCATVYNK